MIYDSILPLRPVACLEFSQDGLQGMIENSLDFGAGELGFELKLYHWIVCDLGQLVEPFWTQFIIWIWQDNLVIFRLVFLAIFYPKKVGGCICLRALRRSKSPIWQPLTKISGKLMGAEAWSWWGRGNLPGKKKGDSFLEIGKMVVFSVRSVGLVKGLVHG